MCGRYTLSMFPKAAAARLCMENIPDVPAMGDVTPGLDVPVIYRDPEFPRPILQRLKWGFVPYWQKDLTSSQRSINARAETVAEKPSFRDSFMHRRCLIPADGFYEWKGPKGGKREPYYFRMSDGEPFFFGGLWDVNEHDGGLLITCLIITTAPNSIVSPVHERMPLILPEPAWNAWLDPHVQTRGELAPFLLPYSADKMVGSRKDTTSSSGRFEWSEVDLI